jgi:hypothetical protein
MGAARARLTNAAVERVFQRQGWRYQVVNDRIQTRFDGVPMLIGVEPSGDAVVLVVPLYIAGAAGRRASQAHEHGVDTFLAAVNYALPIGAYVRDVQEGDIYYTLGVAVPGGVVDDAQLAHAIALAVSTVKNVGPVVEALVTGQISMQQALDGLKRALARAEGGRRSA